jgi:hypothetical protein
LKTFIFTSICRLSSPFIFTFVHGLILRVLIFSELQKGVFPNVTADWTVVAVPWKAAVVAGTEERQEVGGA